MKTKIWVISALLAVLVGCGGKQEETPQAKVESWSEKMARLKETPEVSAVGVFEDCQVSFVDRGQSSDSFFLAKCPNGATTTTKNWETHGIRGGRTEYRETTVVKQRTAAEQKAFEEGERKIKLQKLKESALLKLTPEERNALLEK